MMDLLARLPSAQKSIAGRGARRKVRSPDERRSHGSGRFGGHTGDCPVPDVVVGQRSATANENRPALGGHHLHEGRADGREVVQHPARRCMPAEFEPFQREAMTPCVLSLPLNGRRIANALNGYLGQGDVPSRKGTNHVAGYVRELERRIAIASKAIDLAPQQRVRRAQTFGRRRNPRVDPPVQPARQGGEKAAHHAASEEAGASQRSERNCQRGIAPLVALSIATASSPDTRPARFAFQIAPCETPQAEPSFASDPRIAIAA